MFDDTRPKLKANHQDVQNSLPGLPFECGGDNLWGQMKVVAKVSDAFVGQIPIVVPPCKLFLYITTRLEAGQSFDDLQVGNCFEFWMFWSMGIFFSHHNSLTEKVFIDGHNVLLRHQHDFCCYLTILKKKKSTKYIF